jgi:hypothetical protein
LRVLTADLVGRQIQNRERSDRVALNTLYLADHDAMYLSTHSVSSRLS